MSKTLYINRYKEKTKIKEIDIEILEINQLKYPLKNVPVTLKKIIVKKSDGIYRRENKIPFDCEFIIENLEIYGSEKLDEMTEEEYSDITAVSLNFGELKEIPKNIMNLINLKELSIRCNKITEIPEWIFNLTNLRRLNLAHNQITEIPESISKLTNLQELILKDNQIKEIPESICDLINLKEITLSYNQLVEIPERIVNLTNLQILDVMKNRIACIPEIIRGMTNLREFYYDEVD
jgi:Leucine-rich repeat (LRR) protein